MNVPSTATKKPVPSTDSVSATVPFTLMQAMGMTERFIPWIAPVKPDGPEAACAGTAPVPAQQLNRHTVQIADQKIFNRPIPSPVTVNHNSRSWQVRKCAFGGEALEPLSTSIALALSVLAASPNARVIESITAGTIVVVAQARNHVIFAADSRVGASNGIAVASVDDTYCKIGPLHGNTLFAAAGIVTDPARSWAADTEMDIVLVQAFHGERMGSTDGESALSHWAEAMTRKLITVPHNQLLAYTKSNDGVAATGVLAGIDKDGSAWVHVSKIGFDTARGLSHQESNMAWSGATTGLDRARLPSSSITGAPLAPWTNARDGRK